MPPASNIPKIRVPAEQHAWLQAATAELLDACAVTAHDGTLIYRPDTGGHYDAMWTRDFCYMVEGAGKLIPPPRVAACVDYLLARQRDDGAIPDRVRADGHAVYLAGPEEAPLGAGYPTDNPQFLVKLVAAYTRRVRDPHFVAARSDALRRGLESVPTAPDGAVSIDPTAPHSGYGFTDTVAKTGKELSSTLLLWEAWYALASMLRVAELHEEAREAFERAHHTEQAIEQFWNDELGVLEAATRDCRQPDLWGSAYAVMLGLQGSGRRHATAAFFRDLYADCVLHGHVRHLPAGEYWQRMLTDLPHDAYQNGGYWAVPTGWVARVLQSVDADLAARMMGELIAYFQAHGICEWISPAEGILQGYVASAALTLGAVKPA